MNGFSTVNFSDSDQGLFTPQEIQRLMRIEYERAVRYEYPLALMLLEVDRLERLQDLYGQASKEEIRRATIFLLRSATRASDFLGCLQNDRVLIVFPHTTKQAAADIAARLLRSCRQLEFDGGGRTLRATLSIGFAVSQAGSDKDFDRFMSAAEESLAFAIRSGGDRYVHREEARDLIHELREGLAVEEALLQQVQRGVELNLPSLADLPHGDLTEKISALFRALGERGSVSEALEREVIALAQARVESARDKAVAEQADQHGRQVDVLERRLSKLREMLDATEQELGRIATTKGLDPGVGSIYRSVQGLSLDSVDYERKKEVLTLIFESNVELKRKIEGKP